VLHPDTRAVDTRGCGSRTRIRSTGVLTSADASKVADDLPTPWTGLWERIDICAFPAWVAVLAIVLLREPRATTA